MRLSTISALLATAATTITGFPLLNDRKTTLPNTSTTSPQNTTSPEHLPIHHSSISNPTTPPKPTANSEKLPIHHTPISIDTYLPKSFSLPEGDPLRTYAIYPGDPKVFYGPPWVSYKQNREDAQQRHSQLVALIRSRRDAKVRLMRDYVATTYATKKARFHEEEMKKFVEMRLEAGEYENLMGELKRWKEYRERTDEDVVGREFKDAEEKVERFLKKDIGIRCQRTRNRC